MNASWFGRATLFGLLVPLMACQQLSRTGEVLGVADRSLGVPPTIDVLVDFGANAPGSPENLDLVTGSVLRQFAGHPGTTVRLWWLANSLGESRMLASHVVLASAKPNLRARQAHEARVIAEGTETLRAAAAPFFADFRRRRTPLLHVLGRIAVAGNPTGGSRTILVLSDLRNEDELVGRFECDPLPPAELFLQRTLPMLPPDSLKGTTVIALFAAPDPVEHDRCPARVDRFRELVCLFDAAIAQAGGRFVLSPTAVPTLGGVQ